MLRSWWRAGGVVVLRWKDGTHGWAIGCARIPSKGLTGAHVLPPDGASAVDALRVVKRVVVVSGRGG